MKLIPDNKAKFFKINLPLVHPKFVIHNKLLDDKTIELEFDPNLRRRVVNRISKLRWKLNI